MAEPMIFADGLMDASVTNGVARMTMAQTGPDGKPMPVGQLVMPLGQLPAFANGLLGLMKQIETRMKESRQAASATAASATDAASTGNGAAEQDGPTASVPGSFRFG